MSILVHQQARVGKKVRLHAYHGGEGIIYQHLSYQLQRFLECETSHLTAQLCSNKRIGYGKEKV